MEIQRQADYYGLGYPEHREARLSPAQIAALTRGPEITPGLLNTRTAGKPAMEGTEWMPPRPDDKHTAVDDVAEVFADQGKKKKAQAFPY